MRRDIVVIDSGVNIEHPIFDGIQIDGIYVHYHNGKYEILNRFDDENGHGTAVCGIICAGMEQSNTYSIFMIKIYGQETSIELDALLYALDFIERKVDCDIIHISSGIVEYSEKLEIQCEHLIEKGICIVSAFDNNGAASYPAAFENVIGVDASLDCKKWDEWIYIEEGIVNVLAKGGNHRLAWIGPNYILSQGASFSAGYITAFIEQQIKRGLSKKYISKILKEKAKRVYNQQSLAIEKDGEQLEFNIQKAAIFPYNKEIHSMVNFCDMLPFKIHGIYSTRYLGNIGKRAVSLDEKKVFEIQNIENIDWESIDTFIIGHVSEISMGVGIDYKAFILEKCLSYGINVYSFDSIGIGEYKDKFKARDVKLFYPKEIRQGKIKKDGKLFMINTPVLGVFGTSSVQGKYTTQLYLRKKFLEAGYFLAQMGTEPTALLYGMDTMYCCGYASSIQEKEDTAVEYINYLMHEMEIKSPDIILVGSQSGTIPAFVSNTKLLNIPQLMYLLGTNPDAVVLCINIEDDITYIERTVSVIENLISCKVIAFVISPLVFPNDLAIIRQKKELAQMSEIMKFRTCVSDLFKRPTYIMGREEEMCDLFETCINFFSGEENGTEA